MIHDLSRLRILLRLTLAAAAAAAMLLGQPSAGGGRMDGSLHRAQRRDDSRAALSADIIRSMRPPSRRASLGSLLPGESRRISRKAGLPVVGVSRRLPEDILASGEWANSPDGKRVWRLEVRSEGAEYLRVRFTGFHVDAGKLWLFATGAGNAFAGPYSGDGIFGDGEFWSDLVPGDALIIAYEPAEPARDSIPFRPVEVSHRLTDPAQKLSAPAGGEVTAVPLAAAASCSLDVSCYPQYGEAASAVALMIFESGGETYECTGSLVSSNSSPALPYFLTANHCIGNDTEARSLIAFFHYQTPSCSAAVPALSSLPRVTGATFLAGQPMAEGDFTLVRLSSFPNVDVKVLGWSSDAIASNQQVIGISHPRGDYKRIAFGQRTRDVAIRFADGERMPANVGYQVSWSEGVTQSGSSGSPLLITTGGKEYIVGTLTAGPNVNENNSTQVCRVTNRIASYGRFSVAFPALSGFLTGANTTPDASTAPRGTFAASPNPITLAPGQSLGVTTLAWTVTGAEQVQVRVGSSTGPPMTGIVAPNGSATTDRWVTNGVVFYLQDATSGDSSGAAKTIATLRVQVR